MVAPKPGEDYQKAMVLPSQDPIDLSALRARLRRGQPILVDEDLYWAAEALEEDQAQSLQQTAPHDALRLLLTRRRADVLHVLPSDGRSLALIAPDGWTARDLRDLGDASRDFDHPLRGPFRKADDDRPGDEIILRLIKAARLLPAGLVWRKPSSIPSATPFVASSALAAALDVGAKTLTLSARARLPTQAAPDAWLHAFRPLDGGPDHLALVIGDPPKDQPVLARLHSECFTGDLLGSLRCDCGEQLQGAVQAIENAGGGLLLYLAQEGRGIGLANKLRAYQLQDQGFDTLEANERLGFDADERLFAPAAAMLKALGYACVRLMTNNPDKVAGLAAEGITVTERVPHAFPSNAHNEAYLAAKKKKSGHFL